MRLGGGLESAFLPFCRHACLCSERAQQVRRQIRTAVSLPWRGNGDKREMQLRGVSGETRFSREESRGNGLGTWVAPGMLPGLWYQHCSQKFSCSLLAFHLLPRGVSRMQAVSASSCGLGGTGQCSPPLLVHPSCTLARVANGPVLLWPCYFQSLR